MRSYLFQNLISSYTFSTQVNLDLTKYTQCLCFKNTKFLLFYQQHRSTVITNNNVSLSSFYVFTWEIADSPRKRVGTLNDPRSVRWCFAMRGWKRSVFVRSSTAANLPVKNHKMLKVRFYQEEVTSAPLPFCRNFCLRAESVGLFLSSTLLEELGGNGGNGKKPGFIYRLLFRDKELLCQFPCHSTRPYISPNYTLEKRLTWCNLRLFCTVCVCDACLRRRISLPTNFAVLLLPPPKDTGFFNAR